MGRVIKVKFTTRLRFITEGVSLVISEDPRNIQDQTGFSCNLCFTSLELGPLSSTQLRPSINFARQKTFNSADCSMNCLMERKCWVFKCMGWHNPALLALLSLSSLQRFLCFARVVAAGCYCWLLLCLLLVICDKLCVRWFLWSEDFPAILWISQSIPTMRYRGGILQFLFGFIKILNNGFKITDKRSIDLKVLFIINLENLRKEICSLTRKYEQNI